MSPHPIRMTVSKLSVAALATLCLALPGGEALLAQQTLFRPRNGLAYWQRQIQ